MVNVLKNVVSIITAIIASHFLAVPFGLGLAEFLDIGGSIAGNTLEYYMFGFPAAYVFLIILLFSSWGDQYKYWWGGIVILPAFLFGFGLAPILIFILLVIGLIAWGLGTMTHKTLQRLHPSFMA